MIDMPRGVPGSGKPGITYDEQNAAREFANMACSSEDFPPQMVEDENFGRFLQTLNPQFKLSFKKVGTECMKVYKERKEETKKFLVNFDGRISLSMDILRHESGRWDTFNCEDYLCLYAHFIDENWKLKKWVLNFRSLWGSCESDDYIPEGDDGGMFKLLQDWGIENKISTFTRNDEDSDDSLVKCVKSHIQDKNLQLNGQLFRVHCLADMIKTMVEDVFEMIKDIIDKVRELYSFGRSLPLWYLTTSHLKGALQLWTMGEFSSEDVINSYNVPPPEEWKKVEGVCLIVDKIYEVLNVLFETKHLTSNIYLYHLDELREILTQFSTDSCEFVATLAKDMLKKFDKYWDDMFFLLAISAVLDPRFKMKYIDFVCSKVKGMEGNSQAAAVFVAMNKLFDEYEIRFPEKDKFISEPASDSDSDSDYDSEGEVPAAGNANYTFSVMKKYEEFLQLSDLPAKKTDLHCYLEQPVLPWSQDFDALTWWSTAGAKYPTLSRMARDFLAIPVSVASSFEAFYTEARPADARVVCLKPELMNALVCSRSWYSKH
uniref:zinc finger BED domain-containing protein RICESLEEPER 1-like isoform X1 n=2 Tax=Fragaria vesca subsp. vesca TaxID=101020 RepID=UPI0005CA55E5|nr:PREDICTED: zinc finger BED domain-containing protein RICESLEEPER 1-like isoform X1 [Fragaria vesca subsp. vesca]XP_011462902.1 PREDICTED: zinc finger BED domain-containing protein RICESLEEPER 1-like isoform X1 [Fragaria vesca subsp. vesca]XP_011462903.1 PREDICTED: zinc finger BED domain-containing protein RICESLEEPER 1-like isoform X1 [Fragaria vesca subsp. vesca]XP_011462904.1 PREDICTED: zinc finger BED domain-containing protein RICESLEEPER 1-like isoform X1 [Fragaria vesca subsp. vesca]